MIRDVGPERTIVEKEGPTSCGRFLQRHKVGILALIPLEAFMFSQMNIQYLNLNPTYHREILHHDRLQEEMTIDTHSQHMMRWTISKIEVTWSCSRLCMKRTET